MMWQSAADEVSRRVAEILAAGFGVGIGLLAAGAALMAAAFALRAGRKK